MLYQERRVPRVRSYSMNNYLNSKGHVPPDPGKNIFRTSDMVSPSPSATFVIIDEREDSIDDCVFVVDMVNPGTQWAAIPTSVHHGAGTLSFADGHAELHTWRDPATSPPFNLLYPVNIWNPTLRYNPDVVWIRERTTGLIP